MVESDSEDEMSTQNGGWSSTDETSSGPDDSESSGSDRKKVLSKDKLKSMGSRTIEEKVGDITKKLAENVLK